MKQSEAFIFFDNGIIAYLNSENKLEIENLTKKMDEKDNKNRETKLKKEIENFFSEKIKPDIQKDINKKSNKDEKISLHILTNIDGFQILHLDSKIPFINVRAKLNDKLPFINYIYKKVTSNSYLIAHNQLMVKLLKYFDIKNYTITSVSDYSLFTASTKPKNSLYIDISKDIITTIYINNKIDKKFKYLNIGELFDNYKDIQQDYIDDFDCKCEETKECTNRLAKFICEVVDEVSNEIESSIYLFSNKQEIKNITNIYVGGSIASENELFNFGIVTKDKNFLYGKLIELLEEELTKRDLNVNIKEADDSYIRSTLDKASKDRSRLEKYSFMKKNFEALYYKSENIKFVFINDSFIDEDDMTPSQKEQYKNIIKNKKKKETKKELSLLGDNSDTTERDTKSMDKEKFQVIAFIVLMSTAIIIWIFSFEDIIDYKSILKQNVLKQVRNNFGTELNNDINKSIATKKLLLTDALQKISINKPQNIWFYSIKVVYLKTEEKYEYTIEAKMFPLKTLEENYLDFEPNYMHSIYEYINKLSSIQLFDKTKLQTISLIDSKQVIENGVDLIKFKLKITFNGDKK